MGGMPFGGAFNLPEGELKQRRQALNSTASPAAREMARLRETGTLAIAPPENPSWIVSTRNFQKHSSGNLDAESAWRILHLRMEYWLLSDVQAMSWLTCSVLLTGTWDCNNCPGESHSVVISSSPWSGGQFVLNKGPQQQ